MTKPIVDAEARVQALDPETSFIVQAPAGSGKTELLMQRYLVLLARVESPEEIIAITFTRKATAEMRSRILGALQWAAESPAPALPHELKSWQLAREVLDRDQEFNWHLQLNPNRLRILTIDSLSASLARQMPILSRAGVNPQTTEDASELYRQAAHATLESLLSSTSGQFGQVAAKDIACLLAHLDNDWQKLETMLSSLLQKRDHWLRHLPPVGDSDDLQQERKKLEAGLRTIIEATLEATAKQLPDSLRNEWINLTSFAAENLIQENSTSPLIACAGLQQFPDTSANNLHLWRAMTDLLLTKDSWRKSITKASGFPAPSSSKNPDQKALLTENKQRMVALIENMSELSGLFEQLCAIRELPAPAYTDDQWQILKALFNVLKLSVAQLQLVFREQGQVDFVGVNLAALDALVEVHGPGSAAILGDEGNHTEPTDLALALDYRIKHLLVDEFQDTSVSQYLLLKQLTAGWELEDGRSLFLVGDPMQSIYRFREAEVGLFLNVQQSGYLGHVPVVPIQLRVNFRSDQLVVEWINTIFAKAMPNQASVTSGAVRYSSSVASPVAPRLDSPEPSSAIVQIHPLIEPSGQSGQAEATLVCDLIQQALKESKNKDRAGNIAILVRSKTHLARITQTLQEQGINYQAVELEALMQRSVIRDLHALTRALLHPGDRTAWLSILRAPWCGLTLDDLETLVGLVAPASLTILDRLKELSGDRLNNNEWFSALSEDGLTRLKHFQAVIEGALAQRRRHPLARWIEGVWLSLGGPACLDSHNNNDSDLQNARNYFNLLNQLDDGAELASFKVLEQSLSRLFASPQPVEEGQTAIQLMTIHKAKGLEFDTVIIPGLQRLPRNDDRQLLQWTEWRSARDDRLDDHADQDQLLLAPIEETGSDRGTINQYLSTLEKERSRHEAVRLLYVAATRAKCHLHLIGSVDRNSKGEIKAPDPRSLLARIWPSVEDEFLSHAGHAGQAGDEQHDPSESEMSSFIPYIQRLPADWSLPELPEPVSWQGGKASVISSEPALSPDQVEEQPIEYLWAGAPAKHIGTVVHQLLQQIAEQGLPVWDSQAEKNQRSDHMTPQIERLLKESGATEAVMPMAIQRVQDSLVKMLSDERGRWILSDKHQQARNEYALTGVLQGELVRVILDRTFIDQQGVRWIIDYKSGSHEGGDLQGFLDSEQERYRAQLERYAQLLNKMEDRPIRLGLYFPLLSGWRAWSPEHLLEQ